MITRKVGPALASGCTQIVKPASQTPLTAIEFGTSAVEAGVPPGVLMSSTGPGSTVARRCRRPARTQGVVHRLDRGGPAMIALSAANVTRLSLRARWHAPTIVFDDTDLSVAVAGCCGPSSEQRAVLHRGQSHLRPGRDLRRLPGGVHGGGRGSADRLDDEERSTWARSSTTRRWPRCSRTSMMRSPAARSSCTEDGFATWSGLQPPLLRADRSQLGQRRDRGVHRETFGAVAGSRRSNRTTRRSLERTARRSGSPPTCSVETSAE